MITRAANGDGFDYEYRLLLPSGAVKQVHVVAHAVRGEFGTHEFVGAVMDITVTRQAEAALRQAQAELAHVTRVTTMGELAASIAHEVNQPIAGVVLNGNASLRWLARVKEESIDLKEARETIQRIIRDGNRAGEILGRIRALFKKAEPAKEPLDLNEAIREILLLARSEMNKHQVALRLELADALPPALGDKVQLQQVILNLILNGIDAMNTVEDRSRDLINPDAMFRRGGGDGDGSGLGHRVGFIEHGKSVRRIPYHQTGRPRHGAFDQPVDCGKSPRAALGGGA